MQRVRKGKGTLRVVLVAIVALCWLLPTLVLGVYMSSVFFGALQTKTEQALVAGAAHAEDLTIQELERILTKSRGVTYDEQLYGYLMQYLAGSLTFEELYTTSRTYWQRAFQRERDIPFSAVFSLLDPTAMVHLAADVNSLYHFTDNVLPYVLEVGETLDTRSRYIYVDGGLYHVRNLYNRRMERFGMMVLQVVPEIVLAPLLNERMLWEGQADILLDEYTRVANEAYPFSAETYREGLYTASGDLYYGQQVKTSDYTLSYRIRLDRSVVYGEVGEYFRLIILLLVLLVPLEALMMLFIHRGISRPLLQLADAAQRMAGGELGVTVPAKGVGEIERVGMAFNAMSVQIQNLIDKSYREELALRDARISALQSRINPHFLNNALELMNWQARMEGADSVSQMVEAMSTLLNAALDRIDERTVPLYTEVEVADAYFFFIQQRFGDRVHIEKELDEALREVRVPRLIIQTLLENAVEHGINPAGGGTISLKVYADAGAGMLYIDVRNDGRPINAQEQENVDRLLADTSRSPQAGQVGIRNVNLRLKLIYHEQAGLTLGADERGGTLARIHIPYPAQESGQAQTTKDTPNQ